MSIPSSISFFLTLSGGKILITLS
ncbi:uncharacterized protein METZ01_LOCUS271701, partial [marine metagenome]